MLNPVQTHGTGDKPGANSLFKPIKHFFRSKLAKLLHFPVETHRCIRLKLRLSVAIEQVDLIQDLALSEEGHYENALWC